MLGWLKTNVLPSKKLEPNAEWMAEAIISNPNTPDIWTINGYQYQFVFVYGTQQRGHPQHELINSTGAFAATAYTDKKFNLWRRELGRESFPIAMEESNWHKPDFRKAARERVQGELYAVPTATLISLDKHYQNTLEFQRKRVPVLIPYRHLYQIPGCEVASEVQRKISEKTGAPLPPQVVTTEMGVKLVKAWMYIGRNEYWDDQLSHFFSPTAVYQSRIGWLGDYQAFTQQDYGK